MWQSTLEAARRFDLNKAVENKSKNKTMQNFLDALLAVLAGNAIYYLLMPHLPRAVRHRLFQEDLGLLVDFAICTAIFLVVKHASRKS
jgi:ADP-heptose:LPS heptosyltransferase